LQLGDVFIALEKPEQALAAYRRAARLAPPGREIAWFMAGQCYEVLDDLESACDAYLASLQADPLGISAAERLMDVASQLNNTALSTWIRPRLEHLTAKQRDAAATRSWPYKHLPPPIPNNPA
jgi:tetratricopeptide (TPR) repeat protein